MKKSELYELIKKQSEEIESLKRRVEALEMRPINVKVDRDPIEKEMPFTYPQIVPYNPPYTTETWICDGVLPIYFATTQ